MKHLAACGLSEKEGCMRQVFCGEGRGERRSFHLDVRHGEANCGRVATATRDDKSFFVSRERAEWRDATRRVCGVVLRGRTAARSGAIPTIAARFQTYPTRDRS